MFFALRFFFSAFFLAASSIIVTLNALLSISNGSTTPFLFSFIRHFRSRCILTACMAYRNALISLARTKSPASDSMQSGKILKPRHCFPKKSNRPEKSCKQIKTARGGCIFPHSQFLTVFLIPEKQLRNRQLCIVQIVSILKKFLELRNTELP